MNAQPFDVVPIDPKLFPRTYEVLGQGLQEGVSPGFVAGVWRESEPDRLHALALGNRRAVPSPLPMELDTVFDLASVSKVFATTALTGALVERGWLSWDLPVAAVLPGFRYPDIKVSHLLSHSAGYPAWAPFWEKLREELGTEGERGGGNSLHPKPLFQIPIYRRQELMKYLVLSTQPEKLPGQRILYSDLSFLVLGFLLESIVQIPLDDAVKRFVWDPMGITGASFRRVNRSPEDALDLASAATEECPWRKVVLQGQVHDDNCWAMGGYGGHSGAFARIQDVAQFVRATLTGFYRYSTLEKLFTPVHAPEGPSRTLGWDLPSSEGSSVGTLFSRNSVGHLGFTGTSLWIDLDARLAVILLSNRVHPKREHIAIKSFRPRFHDAVRLDLTR